MILSRPYGMTLARGLASPWLSVSFFLLAALSTIQVGSGGRSATAWMALPLLLLTINLSAAIVVHRRLRVDLSLLVMHLALLVLVVAVAVSRLTFLDAETTLFTGTAFDGRTVSVERGPWHSGRLDIAFANEGAQMRYDAAGHYRGTDNLLTWHDSSGRRQQTAIGDDRPLVIDGYRIYATRNRGLAPLFRWEPLGMPAQLRNVELSDHRNVDYPPSATWTLAEGVTPWVQVRQAPWVPPVSGVEQDFGVATLQHTLVFRLAEQRLEITPGESIELPQGRLTYLKLGTWMGYRIVYDPLANWILASAVMAIASLAWFYANRLKTPAPV